MVGTEVTGLIDVFYVNIPYSTVDPLGGTIVPELVGGSTTE